MLWRSKFGRESTVACYLEPTTLRCLVSQDTEKLLPTPVNNTEKINYVKRVSLIDSWKRHKKAAA